MRAHISTGGQYGSDAPRNRMSAIATWLLVGVPVGLAWFIIWPGIVKTSPTTADAECGQHHDYAFRFGEVVLVSD